MTTIFFNTAWMRYYQGVNDEDRPRDGGSWDEKHEVCNFLPIDGKCYGFVQPAGETIAIERIGAKSGASYVDGVTIVWSARSPSGHTVVVGFYKNARLYRERQILPNSVVHQANRLHHYFAECREEDAILLSYKRRSHRIPRGSDAMGQSLVWYADTARGEDETRKIDALIAALAETKAQTVDDMAMATSIGATAGSFDDDQQALEVDIQSVLDGDLEATEKATLIRARIGQGRFRQQVLLMWRKGCAVTGCQIGALLRASHIKPWRDCTSNAERIDPDNGLMLSANLDALFDRGLISFSDIGAMLIADDISVLDRKSLGLGGPLRVRPSSRQERYLKYHRELHGFR